MKKNKVVNLTLADLPKVLNLVKDDNIWSDITWQIALSNNQGYGIFNGVDKKAELIACIIVNRIDDIVEVEQIYVATSVRRTGLARQLLEFIEKNALTFNCKQIWLEVRETNTSAINLYKQMGFLQTGKRKNYYSAKKDGCTIFEDALLFSIFLENQ